MIYMDLIFNFCLTTRLPGLWQTTPQPSSLEGESALDMDFKTRLVILSLIGLAALVLSTYNVL